MAQNHKLSDPLQELEQAKQEAKQAKQEAERTKQEAERAKQEAERAKQEAERTKQEAERAKQEAERAKQERDVNSAQLNRILKGTNDGFFEWNMVTDTAFHSARWSKLLGYEASELSPRGKTFFERIHPDDLVSVQEATRRHIEHSDPLEVEYRLLCKNGEYRWFTSRSEVTRDASGKPILISGAITDINDRKQIELLLENKRRDLENAVRARDEMVGIISHELKNPLTALQTNSMLIQRFLPKEPELATVRSLIDRQLISIYRMNRLISDLLDVTRLEASALKVAMRACDLSEIVQEVVKMHEGVAQGKQVQLSGDIQPECREVFCDPERTSQVLTNLVSNALKFTNAGGSIRIYAKRAEHAIEVRVTDTGKGISKQDLSHVFDRFWQAKGNVYSGTGLGLAISRGLVEAQGGNIWVESQIGTGTTFYFTLSSAEKIEAEMPKRAAS